jgi:hypothetical protein
VALVPAPADLAQKIMLSLKSKPTASLQNSPEKISPKPESTNFFFKSILYTTAAAAVIILFFLPLTNKSQKFNQLSSSPENTKAIIPKQEKSFCRVYNFSGTFNIYDGFSWSQGNASTKIYDNLRIRTAPNSWLTIQNSTECTYLIGPESMFTISDNGKQIKLEFGCLSETVQKGKGQFKVITPCGKVQVIGTRFDVKVAKNNIVLVAVRQGIVSVSDLSGIKRTLRANESIKLNSKGFMTEPVFTNLMPPMKEITCSLDFISNLKVNNETNIIKSNLPLLPEGVIKQTIKEKDTKKAQSKSDFF